MIHFLKPKHTESKKPTCPECEKQLKRDTGYPHMQNYGALYCENSRCTQFMRTCPPVRIGEP